VHNQTILNKTKLFFSHGWTFCRFFVST